MIDITKLKPKVVEKKKGIFDSIIRPDKTIGYFAAIVAIDALGLGYVLATNPSDLFDTGLFDGTAFEDNLDAPIPKLEPGVYKCQIKIMSFRCNHPEDPEEWDMSISLEDIEEIELKL